MSVSKIIDERAKTYGTFVGNARISQGLKKVMQTAPKWEELADDQKESLELVATKLGRVLNGDPNFVDSWRDLAGYATLVVDRLEGLAR